MTHLMYAKYNSSTNVSKKSPINALDGVLGTEGWRGAKTLCRNNASNPNSSYCLRRRTDINSWENEQLCVLIDHRTSSTQLVLSYQDVLSLPVFIKSLLPPKQLEKDVPSKVTSTVWVLTELIINVLYCQINFLCLQRRERGKLH